MIANFRTITDLIRLLPDEQACIAHLEALVWNGKPVSPFDPSSKVYKMKKGNKYFCVNTNKYFNVRTGTIFEGSKLPLLTWFMAIYFLGTHKPGMSAPQLATYLGTTKKTAWFILHRLRVIMELDEFKHPLGSENFIEADETFIGGKNRNRHKDKRFKAKGERVWPDKMPVIGMLERGGRLVAKAVPNTKLKTLTPVVEKSVLPGATIFTDEWNGYNLLYDRFDHHVVEHNKGRFAYGEICTNGIENVWRHMKRMYGGTYLYISHKHLQAYVDEFVLRYNTRKLDPHTRFNLLLGNIGNKRLKYKDLIK